MTEEADRIRILLIDDEPKGLSLPEGGVPVPQLFQDTGALREIPEIEECFDLRWLATAEETREFRDLSLAIGLHNPGLLGKEGWVPEILCFDYALTRLPEPVDARGIADDLVKRISPLPSLRDLAGRCAQACPSGSSPPTGMTKGEDNLGCFAGGLVFAAFADHPCAPVALTRKGDEKTANTEAGFFEWMLENQSYGTFQAKGRPSPSWDDLIPAGVNILRKRIEQLASASLIQISLDDLLKLAVDGKHQVVTISSRYGRRRYPALALFLDYPSTERSTEAAKWARSIMAQAWQELAGGQKSGFQATMCNLANGHRLAAALWAAYEDDDLFPRRMRLSELLARRKGDIPDLPLTEQEQKELDQHLADFAVKDAEAGRPSCGQSYMELRHPDYSREDRRWAVLLGIVNLLHLRYQALKSRLRSGQKLNYAQLADAATEAKVSPNDVYLLLFPIPATPLVLPWHSEKGDPASSWKKYLTELALDLEDVLDGRGQTVEEEVDNKKKHSAQLGIHAYERWVLRMRAESLGFGRDEWEKDPVSRNVLLGESQ